MLTRQDYLAGRCNFSEYYGEIAQACGISFERSSMLPRIIEALKAGDQHLNTIPLHVWYGLTYHSCARINAAMKQRGDYLTDAGGVCVMKAAAIDAAERAMVKVR